MRPRELELQPISRIQRIVCILHEYVYLLKYLYPTYTYTPLFLLAQCSFLSVFPQSWYPWLWWKYFSSSRTLRSKSIVLDVERFSSLVLVQLPSSGFLQSLSHLFYSLYCFILYVKQIITLTRDSLDSRNSLDRQWLASGGKFPAESGPGRRIFPSLRYCVQSVSYIFIPPFLLGDQVLSLPILPPEVD